MPLGVLRRRDVLDDDVAQGGEGGARVGKIERGGAVASRAVDDREVELVVLGVEVHEQLVDLVEDGRDAGVGPVDLVDHDDHGQVVGERLAEHESRLRQRPFGGVDEQQHAVDHRQRPLDLTAEVGVTGRVDDVERHSVPHDRHVLGQDRDALFLLEVGRVHHPIGERLVDPERARLAQQRVDQGGLAVVDVGDDRQVAKVGTGGHDPKDANAPIVNSRTIPAPHTCAQSRVEPDGGVARDRVGDGDAREDDVAGGQLDVGFAQIDDAREAGGAT